MKKLTLSLVRLICILFSISVHAQVSPEQARNFQINETHTGAVSSAGLIPPLRQKWSVNFGQNISYPLIADGRVFVTVRNATGYGTTLYGLDGATGATIWSYALGGNYWWSASCYEDGRVFGLSGSGMLRAFDAGTGGVIWNRQLLGNTFSTAPSVFEGVIYTSNGGGQLYAVSADTGNILWTAQVINGDNSSQLLH
jgi:outer membrane protein assembly factor BamB